MDLVNLQVGRVILHEVFKRTDERLKVEPQYGVAIEALDGPALDALRDRIVAAMSRSDRCIEMTISKAEPESMVAVASSLVNADEPLYIIESRRVADLLAEAQRSRAIPGGILVVFTGSFGVPVQRLIGVIKAEVHTGFLRDVRDGRFALKFLDKLLLTPQTKLYKIGLFVEHEPAEPQLTEAWRAFIYDETMTVRDRYGAAQYFYDGFLGLTFPTSSARQTKQFHDLTKTFIQSMKIPEEDKVALHNALVTYLKVDQSPTVEVSAFANSYFGDPATQDSYETFMADKGFPDTAINKDLADVERALRLRRLVFRNQVRVIAPAEGFDNLIKIEAIDGEPKPNGEVMRWTRVTIKDRIANQE
jgi:37-kD nucleoid-associated bacterial protein